MFSSDILLSEIFLFSLFSLSLSLSLSSFILPSSFEFTGIELLLLQFSFLSSLIILISLTSLLFSSLLLLISSFESTFLSLLFTFSFSFSFSFSLLFKLFFSSMEKILVFEHIAKIGFLISFFSNSFSLFLSSSSSGTSFFLSLISISLFLFGSYTIWDCGVNSISNFLKLLSLASAVGFSSLFFSLILFIFKTT